MVVLYQEVEVDGGSVLGGGGRWWFSVTHSTRSVLQGSPSPRPLASEELNLLARLMGGLEVLQRPGSDPAYRVNLFTMDPGEEEEEA